MTAKILQGPKLSAKVDLRPLGQILFDNADKFADKIMQIDATTDERESFGQVKKKSIRLAIELKQRGITKGDIVGISSKNSLEITVAVTAALYLGAVVVPYEAEPSKPTITLQNTIATTLPKLVFVAEQGVENFVKAVKNAEVETDIIVLGNSAEFPTYSQLIQRENALEEGKFQPSDGIDVHDTAVMIFSSGSEGFSKAICHSHFSFLYVTYVTCEGLVADTLLASFSMYSISGLGMMITSYIKGSCRVINPELKPESMLKIIEKYKITAIYLPPFFTTELNNCENRLKYDVSSIRQVFTGGVAIQAEDYRKLDKLFTNADVSFSYGLTEASLTTVMHSKTHRDYINSKEGSAGVPVAEMQLKVVDVDTREILPPNQEGEICIKTPALFTGYYKYDNSAEFDEEHFFKTGDIGYYDEDDFIYIVDRIKEMFKYKYFKVIPAAVEAALMQHPAVKEAVVVGIPDAVEGRLPKACVVLKESCTVSEEELQNLVDQKVPDTHRLRGGILFVKSLPKTPTGKFARKEIKDAIMNGNME